MQCKRLIKNRCCETEHELVSSEYCIYSVDMFFEIERRFLMLLWFQSWCRKMTPKPRPQAHVSSLLSCIRKSTPKLGSQNGVKIGTAKIKKKSKFSIRQTKIKCETASGLRMRTPCLQLFLLFGRYVTMLALSLQIMRRVCSEQVQCDGYTNVISGVNITARLRQLQFWSLLQITHTYAQYFLVSMCFSYLNYTQDQHGPPLLEGRRH